MQALVEPRREILAAKRNPRSRALVAGLLVASMCALTAFVESFVLGGVIFPIAVASRSMAPALLGPVRAWTCASCGQEFVCSLDSLPEPPRKARCPNCGAAAELEAGRGRSGQRVFVERATALFRPFLRWQPIVYRDHEEPFSLCVKRVVGLPGESIEIVEGEVLVEGRVAKKTLAQFREMAVHVHGPTIDSHSWNRAESSRWQVEAGRAQFAGLTTDDDLPIEWLTYRHRQNVNVSDASSILDESPCDQAESRVLNSVHDLALACRARVRGPGQLCLRVRSGHGEFVATLAPQLGTGLLTRDGIAMGEYKFATAAFANGTRVELAIVDQRAMLAVSGDTVFSADFDAESDSPGTLATELAIGARNVEIDVLELSVLRDVCYAPAPSSRPAKVKLGPGEYYVLGDNSPHAIDSRNGGGTIKKAQILGVARWW